MLWTETMDAQLTRLLADGLSSSQIAAQMCCGISRNAVIGRVSRLGLSRPVVIKKKKLRKPPAAPKVRAKPVSIIVNADSHRNRFRTSQAVADEIAPIRCAEVIPRNVSLIDLEPDDCRYPYGDGPFVFCGHAKEAGSPYCYPHSRLVIQSAGRPALSQAERLENRKEYMRAYRASKRMEKAA